MTFLLDTLICLRILRGCRQKAKVLLPIHEYELMPNTSNKKVPQGCDKIQISEGFASSKPSLLMYPYHNFPG